MRSLLRLISAMSRIERIALSALLSVLLLSFAMLLRTFYVQSTDVVPKRGGTYIEGSVGEVLSLHPWLVTGNDVNRDINALIFSGLLKYDPASATVIDDLAHVHISNDNRIFTATLKPDLFWHDTSDATPHPVTADDILFTFKTTQEQGFPNPILQQNFRGVDMEKIDARTVRFTLKKPYAFFTSNLTMGLIPKAAFTANTKESLRAEALDFGFRPIGAGPYKLSSLQQSDTATEVTLERFDRKGMPSYNIERVVFRVFPDYSTLLSDIINLNGVRLVPRNEKGLPIIPRSFRTIPFILPQYVGLFFNLDRPVPSDANVRLGLQLGTNKQEIVNAIHETHIIDTPLLEIDLGDWRYNFDAAAARGAFFESNWNIPEKIRLQRLLEQREANNVGPLSQVERVVYLGTGSQLFLTGSVMGLKLPMFVNGIRIQTGSVHVGNPATMSGSWMVKIPAGNGASGSLNIGSNILRMTDAKGDIIDTAFIERYTKTADYALARREQNLVDQFVLSRTLPENDSRILTVGDLSLEHGFLRRRKDGDLPRTRKNEKGKELTMTLLTSPKPDAYPIIANIIRQQWRQLGANIILDIPASKQEFEQKLLKREYDIVLFGESLLDNLDSYPYWHSSQIQEREERKNERIDALNLSQYASFEVDALLARIRETKDPRSRSKALSDLQTILRKEVPAIALYSPLYVFGYHPDVGGVNIGKLSLHADRFSNFQQWFVATHRKFKEGKSWLSFVPWLVTLGR